MIHRLGRGVALLLVVLVAGVVGAADEGTTKSIYSRWQLVHNQVEPEPASLRTTLPPFPDRDAYQRYIKATEQAANQRRTKMLAQYTALWEQANAENKQLLADDHLGLALTAHAIAKYGEMLRHAEAADSANPDDPRVSLVLMLAQLNNDNADGAEKTLARFPVGASLPDMPDADLYLVQSHNQFRRHRRLPAILKTQELLVETRRAQKDFALVDYLFCFNMVNLPTYSAVREGWGVRAVELLEREQHVWEKDQRPLAAWIAQRLFARKLVVLAELGKKDEAREQLAQALAAARKERDAAPQDLLASLRLITLEQADIDLHPPAVRLEVQQAHLDHVHAAVRQFPFEPMAVVLGIAVTLQMSELLRHKEYQLAIEARETLLGTLQALPEEFATSPAMANVWRLAFRSDGEIEAGKRREQLVGKPAPPLHATAWINGQPLAANDLRGKVVLIDFWAVWCGPCIRAFPNLKQWHDQYADRGLVTIGVTRYYQQDWDAERSRAIRKPDISHADEQIAVEQFARHHQLPYPLAFDDEDRSLFGHYGVEGIPQLVLIDRQGIVRLIKVGLDKKHAEQISQQIEALLTR